jgi:endonuclease/exonuclease/phosphatase family metal-dependent hydrolase
MNQLTTPDKDSADAGNFERLRLSAAAVTLATIALLAPNTAAAEDVHPSDAPVAASPVETRSDKGPIEDIAITTYNILGADHVDLGREVGGAVDARAHRVVRFILGKAGARQSDIVGMQEVQSVQRRLFNAGLHNSYGSIPKNNSSQNPIFYNKDRFDLLSTGTVRYPYYGDPGVRAHNGKAVWGRFKDTATGQTITVLNEHPVAWNQNRGSDTGGALKREKTARIIAKWTEGQRKAHPDDAMFDIGDMNSINMPLDYFDPYFTFQFKDRALHGNRDRLPYCIKTEKETGLQDSRDVLSGNMGHCPTTSKGPAYKHQIDWIYLNPTYTDVKSWRIISNNTTRHASDHMPVMVVAQANPEALPAPADEPTTESKSPSFAQDVLRRLTRQHRADKGQLQYAATPSYTRQHRVSGPDH